jgi:hypothetical protein
MASSMTPDMLRHAVATAAYRGAKVLRDAPAEFGAYRVKPGSRTPVEILAHMGDLFDWALSMAKGEESWHDSSPLMWQDEVARFYISLTAFDEFLAGGPSIACSPEGLLQGPIADALSHIGQLAMLRRLSGSPVRGENYFKAGIVVGRVGPEQAAPQREFD